MLKKSEFRVSILKITGNCILEELFKSKTDLHTNIVMFAYLPQGNVESSALKDIHLSKLLCLPDIC